MMGIFDFFKKKLSLNDDLTTANQNKAENNDAVIMKSGYLELINLCLNNPKQTSLKAFIETYKPANSNKNQLEMLTDVINYADENEISFLMVVDWKEEIGDLTWKINRALNDNFNIVIDLPKAENYETSSVSTRNVWEDFDKALKFKGFKIGFLDMASDEYIIFVHHLKDEKEIVMSVQKIGYQYLDVNTIDIDEA